MSYPRTITTANWDGIERRRYERVAFIAHASVDDEGNPLGERVPTNVVGIGGTKKLATYKEKKRTFELLLRAIRYMAELATARERDRERDW